MKSFRLPPSLSGSKSLPWLLGIGLTLFYVTFHSTFYCFDGVACAIAVELGEPRNLTHGNHLAYGLVGLGFFKLWQALGYQGPALFSLHILDSLLGAAAAGVFCGSLLSLGLAPATALLAAAGLAVSFAWWLWSLEAQVYMLGCLFIVLAAKEALCDEPRPARVGFWQALAVLGHVGHVMFAPAAAYLLWTSARARGKGAGGLDALGMGVGGRGGMFLSYGAGLTLPVLAAYVLVAVLWIRPESWDAARIWLLGSAALSADKSFYWIGGPPWHAAGLWLAMGVRVFSDAMELSGPTRTVAWMLGGSAAFAAMLGAGQALGLRGRRSSGSADTRRSRLAKGALIWLAGYALLYASWQPGTMVYRISDLLPAWLLIALACDAAPWGAASRTLLAGWVLAAGLFNGVFLIAPWTDPSSNTAYQKALWLKSVTPEHAWIASINIDQVYVPYFAHRKPLNFRYHTRSLDRLEARLANLEASAEPVFITSDTLESYDRAWEPFFKGYGLAELGVGPGGVKLYRLRKGKPKGRR